MEFKQYRESGELSDLTVYVDNERFKLHKFPLFTKSEYFKEVTGNNPVCQLNDFPGGSKIFSLIADFCYSKEIEINSHNVSYLYFAADMLKMKGKENLMDITKRYINEIFAKAENKINFLNLLCVICSASVIKSDIASKLLEDSLSILQSSWIRKCPDNMKFDFKNKDSEISFIKVENLVTDYIVYIPLDAFIKFVKETEESGVDNKIILNVCSKYLARIFDNYVLEKSENLESRKNLNTLAENENVLHTKGY